MSLPTAAPARLPARSQPAPGRRRQWLKRVLLGLLAALILLPLLGALVQSAATAADKRRLPAPGQLVDIGGYRLHLDCRGEHAAGSPTIVLEQGLGGISAAWARVQPALAEAHRVCAYDRAGMGWSQAGPAPRDAAHIAAELHRLLETAGEQGPYILVGWSFGGLYARMYAGQYPEAVAGLVLLDSSHPDQWTSTPAGQAQYQSNASIYAVSPWLARVGVMRLMGLGQPASGLPEAQAQALQASFAAAKDWDAQSAEFLASPATNAQVRAAGTLGAVPLYVLSATAHGTPPEQEQLWQGWQSELSALSTNSVHQVVDGADHAAFWLDPDTAQVSVAAILRVVDAVRTGAPLQP